MTRLVSAIVILACSVFLVGCIEELEPKVNLKPNVRIVRGPKDGDMIYDDGVDFQWDVGDLDDDMARGKVFVRLDPDSVTWYNPDTDREETFILTYRDKPVKGWLRWYESDYRWSIRGLPDTVFTFEVKAIDPWGADNTLSVTFVVRFDKYPPEIDRVEGLPPAKLSRQMYTLSVTIYAHDRARTPGAETPVDEIQYKYSLVGPPGFKTVETEWIYDNNFSYVINGQEKAEYKFTWQLRDRVGNVSPPRNAEFEFTD
ncbi:MAG: hypothetical protein ACUVUU_01495 [bacterium]